MKLDIHLLQPTPSDFADFVYCAAKWRYRKDRSLDTVLDAYAQNYGFSAKKTNLSLGQKNEKSCVNWVIKNFFYLNSRYTLKNYQYSPVEVMFNGMEEDSRDFLTSVNIPLGITMLSKPDLLISKYDKIILFEFKAVSSESYLDMPEFESNHAQVWCYSNTKEFQIDEYVLFRYFISPYRSTFKHLSPQELDDVKFQALFEQYVQVIEFLKKGDNHSARTIIAKNSPIIEYKKCGNCIFKKTNICQYQRYASSNNNIV